MKPPYRQKIERLLGFNSDDTVEIYTRRAVFWFSLLFNPIFGGVLLMQNLRDVGYKRKGIGILLFSIAAFVIPIIILRQLALNAIIVVCMNVIVNIPTAYILADYFFVKYFPDNNYFPKSVIPVFFRFVFVGLAVVFFLVLVVPLIIHRGK